ncbi:MAG: response regulator [Bacillota bacterium]
MANILIIDDSAFLRRSVNKLLSEQGMDVFEAENLAQVRENRFSREEDLKDMDLILLDIYLQGEKGLDILPYLRNKYSTIPVLILSMDNSKETVLRAFELKANDYILKPFDEQKLISKIKYYLDLSDECIANPKKCAVEDSKSKDEFDYFQVDLLKEISRSLRSELPFSIIKLGLKGDSRKIVTKEKLLNSIRDIDQIYTIGNDSYLFLLPLTGKEGVVKLISRLELQFNKELDLQDLGFVNKISFPEDITAKVEKNKAVEYQQEIIERLNRN